MFRVWRGILVLLAFLSFFRSFLRLRPCLTVHYACNYNGSGKDHGVYILHLYTFYQEPLLLWFTNLAADLLVGVLNGDVANPGVPPADKKVPPLAASAGMPWPYCESGA